MALSVVVPTWNEEIWLPRLLLALSRYPIVDEVVVADNRSIDQTRSIAEANGCIVVEGGRPGAGRNRGAEAASGDWLLFIDADVLPTDAAFAVVERHMSTRNAAVHFALKPITDDLVTRGAYWVADRWFRLLDAMGISHGLVNFLLVPMNQFLAVGGFNEDLDPGEDVDFIHRISKLGKVDYHRDARVFVSARRFGAERPIPFIAKTLLWEVQRLVGARSSVPSYCWVRHNESEARREDGWLAAREVRSP